ncbi:galactosylceramide sulfotransferase-like [Diadema antillarum]|uniref:galactosylceramide sulfotransferase-like n=1 Tax=Diadema antillarum TaxID=105358 RepID=UPI003A8487F8
MTSVIQSSLALEVAVQPMQFASRSQSTKPDTSLVLIKTHKTGGTTVASILNRFGFKHRLSFLFNMRDYKHGHFRMASLGKQKGQNFLPPLCVSLGDYKRYRGNYDMMTAHLRFLPNLQDLHKYMKADARYISILREPSAQWESAFSFFGAARSMNISAVRRGSTNEANIAVFLSDPERYWGKPKGGHAKFYTRNGQMFDFTSDTSIHTNKNTVSDIIKRLDEALDLVLITEHFDESLVLLKTLMNWGFADILYVKKNERAKHSNLSEEQRNEIREWNSADVSLYEHFNRTLWEKIATLGEKFQSDLATFKHLLDDHYRACVIGSEAKARKGQRMLRIAHKTSNKSAKCKRLVSENYETTRLIMKRQKNRLGCPVTWKKTLSG